MENLIRKHNSSEMKTIVETFVIEETEKLIYDNEELEKWNKYVDDLGLTGQKQIVKPDKSPIPFMHLKTSMKNVFETLCPRKVKVEQYNVTPIPVEILDLVSLSKKEGYFHEIQIWYDEKSPDPVCLGVVGEYIVCDDKGNYLRNEKDNYIYVKSVSEADEISKLRGFENAIHYFRSWDATYYLLGKWADVKHSFEELKEMATKRFISEKENEYNKALIAAQRGLADSKQEAFDKFN